MPKNTYRITAEQQNQQQDQQQDKRCCGFCLRPLTLTPLLHTALAFDDGVCLQHHGPTGHPERPERLEQILDLLRAKRLCCRFQRTRVR